MTRKSFTLKIGTTALLLFVGLVLMSWVTNADTSGPACHKEAGATCTDYWAEGVGEEGWVTFYAVDANGLHTEQLWASDGDVASGAWELVGDAMVSWEGARGGPVLLECEQLRPTPRPEPTATSRPTPGPTPNPTPEPDETYVYYLPITPITPGRWIALPTSN